MQLCGVVRTQNPFDTCAWLTDCCLTSSLSRSSILYLCFCLSFSFFASVCFYVSCASLLCHSAILWCSLRQFLHCLRQQQTFPLPVWICEPSPSTRTCRIPCCPLPLITNHYALYFQSRQPTPHKGCSSWLIPNCDSPYWVCYFRQRPSFSKS